MSAADRLRQEGQVWRERLIMPAVRSDLTAPSVRARLLRAAGCKVGEGAVVHAGLRVVRPGRVTIGRDAFINYDRGFRLR